MFVEDVEEEERYGCDGEVDGEGGGGEGGGEGSGGEGGGGKGGGEGGGGVNVDTTTIEEENCRQRRRRGSRPQGSGTGMCPHRRAPSWRQHLHHDLVEHVVDRRLQARLGKQHGMLLGGHAQLVVERGARQDVRLGGLLLRSGAPRRGGAPV